MADADRHAAWQTEPTFAVRLLTEDGAEADIARGLPDFNTAVDVAVDWLGRSDPEREGRVRLAVVRVGVESQTVWAYPPEEPGAAHELVALYGFNPVTWRPQNLNRPPAPERVRRLPAAAAPPAPDAEDFRRSLVLPAEERRLERLRPPGPPSADRVAELWAAAGRAIRSSWDDRLARVLLIAAVFSVWSTLALLEPGLVPVSIALVAAFVLRQRRLAAVVDDEVF
jgi:hypothetical protein